MKRVHLLECVLMGGVGFGAADVAMAKPQSVVCVATSGRVCGLSGDCTPDARYETVYTVDIETKTVTAVSSKHLERDKAPTPDNSNYVIVKIMPQGVVAVGDVGLLAVETVYIGTNEYLSSKTGVHLGGRDANVFVMVGSCRGLQLKTSSKP